jgi:hypothetical protein
VRSLAANADPGDLDSGTSFVLEVDDETFTLSVDDNEFVATDAATDVPTATISGHLRDFFSISKGEQNAAQRLTIKGDLAAAKRFIRALTGTMGATRQRGSIIDV